VDGATLQHRSSQESPPEREPRVHKRALWFPTEITSTNTSQGDRRVGLPGAYQNVVRITQYLKKCERDGEPLPDSPPGLSPAKAKGILITRPEKCTEQQRLTIERIKMVDRNVGRCRHLFEEFARLFRERDDYVDDVAGHNRAQAMLQQWMEEAKESEIPELKAFAAKLLQDLEAVVAAMVWPYSQGQTERVGSTSSSSARCTGAERSIC
jgi:hypothetical protein